MASRWWPVPLLMVSGFLLLSMGGAVIAAPLTVPLCVLAVYHESRYRWPVAIIGGLTVAEFVWALTYLIVNEQMPWIVALPVVGALVFATAVLRMRRVADSTRSRPGPSSPVAP